MKKSKKEKNWVMIVTKTSGTRKLITKDNIVFSFYGKKLKSLSENVAYGRISIGSNILKKMGWEKGNLICVYYDKDNEMDFMITRSESNGITLSKYNDTYAVLNFKWDGKTVIDTYRGKHGRAVNFTTDKKCIYFEYK